MHVHLHVTSFPFDLEDLGQMEMDMLKIDGDDDDSPPFPRKKIM